jgi:hypothetical protein
MPDFGDGTVTQTKGTWVMLNTKFWGCRVDRDTNFTPTPFIKPENRLVLPEVTESDESLALAA